MQIEMTEMNTISTIIATTVTGITIAAMLITGSLPSSEEMVIKYFVSKSFTLDLINYIYP